jgi:hypothetical protein
MQAMLDLSEDFKIAEKFCNYFSKENNFEQQFDYFELAGFKMGADIEDYF